MTAPVQPGPVHLDTGARALDALPPGEAALFDAHLTGCPSCAAELAGFTETLALLAAAVATEPPPGLWDRVTRAIDVTPQLPPVGAHPAGVAPEGGRHRRPGPWWRRPATLLLTAAAVVAAAVAGAVIATRGPGETPAEAAQQCVAAAQDARVVHPTVGVGGSIRVATSCHAAVLHPAPLPAPAAGKAYQLWVIAGTAARSAGMLAAETSPAGTVTITGLRPADTDIGVTLEPAAGSKTPTSAPVWVAPLHP